MHVACRSGSARILLALIVLLAGLLALMLLPGAADAKRGKVTVKITTKTQAQLLKQGKIKVRVQARKRTRVRVKARGGIARAKTTRVGKRRGKGRRAKIVRLRLTKKGRQALRGCGAPRVRVVGSYRKGKKRRSARASRRLKPSAQRCKVPLQHADRCDFLDPAVCLQPFPNDYFTRKDPGSETGKRLDIDPASTPANTDGVHIDPTDMNRADGFSPGNLITVKIPEVDTPAAFANSGIVPIDDLHAYDDPGQAVIVINAETGERQPIWAELDANPTSTAPSGGDPGGINDNPANTGPVNLIIRPAVNWDFGTRYIVALRNLRDAKDRPVEAPIGFRVYRDGLPTAQKPVEDRRAHMESLIDTLTSDANVKRKSLYMAWDFTVASQDSVTGRATTIRDDAFARLGDTDLANRTIEGDPPDFDITGVLNPGDAVPPGDRSLPDQIERRVYGTISVPCYLDQDGCPPGAEFAHDASGGITWDEARTVDVPFRCEIPKSVLELDPGNVTPAIPGTYGHGLLGTQKQLTGQAELANRTNTIWCAMDWAGFAEEDIPTVLQALGDMSNFNKLADRMQQGFVNFMYLGRALIHPDGLADAPAFQFDPDEGGPAPAASAIDTSAGADSRLNYMGVSQGAIMGGALTALEPDADRGVLNVTGMNYSTLLRRSVDSDEYFRIPGIGLYAHYPNELERPLLLSLVQLLWDRGEANGYAHNLGDDPLPNTPPHEVLLQAAIGDHQVANVAAEVEARTVGASVYTPALAPGRHWDVDPFLGIPEVDMNAAAPFTGGSMLVYYDGGPAGWISPTTNDEGSGTPPDENVPPRPEWGFGGDPHGYPRAAEDGLTQEGSFLSGAGVPRCASASGLCFSNGWTGAP